MPVLSAISTDSSVELKVKPSVQAEVICVVAVDAYPCVPVWSNVICQLEVIAP